MGLVDHETPFYYRRNPTCSAQKVTMQLCNYVTMLSDNVFQKEKQQINI